MYALSWKLLIIGLLLEYFATVLKMLHLKKIARKCSLFLHQLYFFLWEGIRHFFLEKRIKFLLGRTKGRGRGVCGTEWGVFLCFAKFQLFSKTHTLPDKLFQVILISSSWSKTTLLVHFKEQIWLPNRKYYGKNKLYFDQEEMLRMAWISTPIGFWVLRLYIQMFLSYGLYVYITFETACHRTPFGIICNSTQNTKPEENSQKMFPISSPIVLFSYGKVKDLFLDKDQILSREGVWGRSPKWGLYLQNSHY